MRGKWADRLGCQLYSEVACTNRCFIFKSLFMLMRVTAHPAHDCALEHTLCRTHMGTPYPRRAHTMKNKKSRASAASPRKVDILAACSNPDQRAHRPPTGSIGQLGCPRRRRPYSMPRQAPDPRAGAINLVVVEDVHKRLFHHQRNAEERRDDDRTRAHALEECPAALLCNDALQLRAAPGNQQAQPEGAGARAPTQKALASPLLKATHEPTRGPGEGGRAGLRTVGSQPLYGATPGGGVACMRVLITSSGVDPEAPTTPAAVEAIRALREGRGVSDQYGVRDAACPISTG